MISLAFFWHRVPEVIPGTIYAWNQVKVLRYPFFTDQGNYQFYHSKLPLFLILSVKKSWMKKNVHIFVFVLYFKDFSEETKKKVGSVLLKALLVSAIKEN